MSRGLLAPLAESRKVFPVLFPSFVPSWFHDLGRELQRPSYLDSLWLCNTSPYRQIMDLFRSAQPSLLDRAWLMIRYPYDIVRNPLDAFLSIPALSFLIIPTFSSYSTSLNLLFFYLTWSTLLLSNSPLKIEVVGTFAIRVLFYVLPSLGFLAFDSSAPKVAAGIKEHGEDALPLCHDPRNKRSIWWKIAFVSVGNVFLGVALQAGIELLFTQVLHIRSALRITTTLPLPWSIVVDLVKGLLLREVSLTTKCLWLI